MPAPALALPLLVSFAEAAGITISAIATAAGIDKLSDKVEEYIEDNPENAQKIFAMIMPEQGLANILKNESDEGEEISEEELGEIEKPKLTGKEKSERIKAAIRRARGEKGLPARGNYSSPDAEGPAVNIGGSVIREVEDMGIADKDLKDNYDPNKKKFNYKRFYKKKYANGGGVGSMMKRKSFKGGGSDASKSDFGKTTNTSTNREKGIMSRGQGPKGTTGTTGNTSSDNNPIVNRTIENNKPDKYRFAKLKKEPAGLTVLQDIFPFLNKYKAPPAILNEPEEDTKFDYKLLNSFLSEDPLLQTYYDKGLLKNNNIKKFNENEFKKGYMSNEDFQKDISEDKRDLHGYTYTGGTQFPTPETAKNIYINNLESFKKPVGPLYGTKELSDNKGNVGQDYLDAKSYSLGPVTAPGGQRDFLTNRERINQDLNSDSKYIRENALSNIFGNYYSSEDVLEDTYQRENEGFLSGQRDENGNPYKAGYSGTDSPTMTERNKQIAETIGHEARHQLIGTNLTDESKFTAPFGPASFEERFANSLPSLPGTNLGATDRSGKSNFPGVYGKHESLNRMLDFKAYNDPEIYETVYEGMGMPRNLTNRYTDALDKNANLFTQQFANGGRVNYNQGSNWWDTLDPQGMNVYNSMKRGGHDDATIQGQLSMLGYYDPNAAPPDSTPDTPVVQQLGYQGGDNDRNTELTKTYSTSPGDPKNYRLSQLEGTSDYFPPTTMMGKTTNFLKELFPPRVQGTLGDRMLKQSTGVLSKIPSLTGILGNLRSPFNPESPTYNPNLPGQLNFLEGTTGTKLSGDNALMKNGKFGLIEGQSMIGRDPNSGGLKYGAGSVLEGQNVISGFGSNDYETALDKYMEKMRTRGMVDGIFNIKNLTNFQAAKLKRAQDELNIYTGRQDKKAAAAAAAEAKAAYAQAEKDRATYAALEKSITSGQGDGGRDRPDSGPTATGAGMGVGGGYASDYGFLKNGGSVGVGSMFKRKR